MTIFIKYNNRLVFSVFLLYCVFQFAPVGVLFAESNVSINSFKKTDYGGENQNWDISISEKGFVFIANNAGLLVLDGSGTHLFELPNHLIARSVAAIGDRVYTGSFEEFGYWEKPGTGEWTYHSLVPLIKNFTFHNDEIWKIVEHKGNIYFQSFGAVFCYDQQSIEPLNVPGSIMFLLKSGDRIFTHHVQGGLYEIIDKRLVMLSGSEIFSQTEIKAIMPLSQTEMLIGTSTKGIFSYDGKQFKPWISEANNSLIESTINNGIRQGDKLIFGTILNGIFILDLQGKIVNHLHSGNSIQNNTILALKGDPEGNLWVGMDKGFDYVSFNSPLEGYHESVMKMGTVYTASLFKGELYVGSNQGVYYYTINQEGRFVNCSFLPNSQGQVWFLKIIDGQLYCGMNNGTYVIDDHKLIRVSDANGGYNLVAAGNQGEEMFLQSTYSSLVVFEKNSKTWQRSRFLNGFIAPVRYLEIDHLGNIILGHSITGIYLLQPNSSFTNVLQVKKLNKEDGLLFSTNRVVKVDNRIVFPGGDSLFQWDAIHGKIVPFTELNNQLIEFKSSTNIIPVPNNKYWLINRNEIGLFEIRFGKAQLLFRIIPKSLGINLVENNENIIALNDSLHLICMENGFSILNIQKMNKFVERFDSPVIQEIVIGSGSEKTISGPWGSRRYLNNTSNNIKISYASSEPIGKKIYYRSRLQGFENEWSDWTTSTTVEYNRLPPGDYLFNVKTLTNKGIETPGTQLAFTILQPWYLALPALLSYFVLLAAFLVLLRINFRRRRWKHQEQVLKQENEKMRVLKEKAEAEMIKVANEKLQSEVSMKNMELAKNTMSVIRKNEALIEVKDELEKQKEELGYRLPNKYFDSVIRLIDKNITSDHDWEMFENHFDQAHENFFKKLKTQYPDLTPHDFRLCAYLKLNLSSKEIAPLLNITIRGVEEKRYRLRKRLNLASDQGLTEFIMKF
jgi:DNA-binding CsgD family transcriptional regulator